VKYGETVDGAAAAIGRWPTLYLTALYLTAL
jgi:hypothetical protein